jgi:hypothetical protein
MPRSKTVGTICRRSGICNTRKVERFDAIGRLSFVCEPCERNLVAGLCRDCPATLDDPNAFRCNTCRVEHVRKLSRDRNARYYKIEEKRRRMLRTKKESGARPAVRQRRKTYMDAYHKAHPTVRDAALRLYCRTWSKTAREDPEYLEAYNARRRDTCRYKRYARMSGRPVSDWPAFEALELHAWRAHARRETRESKRPRPQPESIAA